MSIWQGIIIALVVVAEVRGAVWLANRTWAWFERRRKQ